MEKVAVAVTAVRVIAEVRAAVMAKADKVQVKDTDKVRAVVMAKVDRVQVKDMDKVRAAAPIKAILTSISINTSIVMVMVRVVVKEAACKEHLSLLRRQYQHQSHQMVHKQLYLFS